jgi:hypothetical protein
MMVGTVSHDTQAPRSSPAATVQVGDPPPSDESARESPVRWLDGRVVSQQWRLGFGPNSPGTGHYLKRFLHRIIDGKNLNTILV